MFKRTTAILCLVAAAVLAAPPEAQPMHITPEQCRQHSLPEIDLRLDTRGTAMIGRPLSEQGVYLHLSGPPGGPLVFSVLPTKITDPQDLHSEAEKLFASSKPMEMGSPGHVTLAGQDRPCLGLVTGTSMARTRWCLVFLAADKARPGVLVLLGCGAGTKPADDGVSVFQQESLAHLTRSLQLGP